ncbi:ABC transporter permease [Tenuibacillus multivorans]|uniref:ABC-2 type transport system permease protein n=1 Tax=Tenuibacillus multivorans TaxID=237069 RepID=A0A1G9WF94_9BACI|nr:ABC transporter permease [Tenuibacillus multivorans]GEL76419.1 sodium transporter [Tenuibacillus multivorans]SDM82705.1 ABC-2 type transport system permease protein [Tenuibacillus multivorans]
MRNSLKVAKWEFRRNIRNKSFIVSLFLTPVIFVIFATAPTLLSSFGDDESESTKVYLNDQLGVYDSVEPAIEEGEFVDWDVEQTDADLESMKTQLQSEEESAYILLNDETVETGTVTYLTGDELGAGFESAIRVFEQPIKQLQLKQAGLSAEQMQVVANPIQFESVELTESTGEAMGEGETMGFPYERAIPAIFAGLVLFSIVISGMMIFQSASQEKKDKVAEIILSSVTTGELMQGKILGYFSLGILQVAVWLTMALPIAIWKLDDVPLLEYLFVPETLLLTFIAVLGYLLFASIFVGLGATIEDYSTSGNFQGFVLMIPFLPFVLIGPIFSNPSGVVAQVASYVPFTAPGVLIMRLSALDEWPWIEIIIAIAVLILSIWIFMKLAGKIFQVGILIYGKNATPQEIWKWLRA